MSPRLIVLLTVVGTVAAGGIITWITVDPKPTTTSGSASPAAQPAYDEEQHQHRELFFGGDTTRDIRGGQEMKPRW